MQAVALSQPRTSRDLGLLEQMYRLRARVFAQRLGWVACKGERECDEFDALEPTYILAIDEQSNVVGCARLLPACGPTMLQTLFSCLLGGGDTFRPHASMIESSRFCVDIDHCHGMEGRPLHLATRTMFAAIAEWSFLNGYNEIVTVTDVRLERLLNRSGWPMRRLGEPRLINETPSVAGVLAADQATFERICPADYHSEFVERVKVA
ncbi:MULTISPECIES: acyl-homoserine-lactone synthase [unclassified Rhizobium]|uniref:acyl-homoserine-lactone synthase n=1 Tax=unclassified Rhizobium TaxID=2613769 RepID=UPI000470DAE8|nr:MULTISPECIES: acyl-homoserine-lactone synthase [unclassified Rhizobium]MBD9452613.1 GNAT family N-acetyltransferase [Rhizobium sp. RHZ02]